MMKPHAEWIDNIFVIACDAVSVISNIYRLSYINTEVQFVSELIN